MNNNFNLTIAFNSSDYFEIPAAALQFQNGQYCDWGITHLDGMNET